jgi:signal transduction histidine kinase/phage shock protein PspC (stress-responsive transcriptional regulator)
VHPLPVAEPQVRRVRRSVGDRWAGGVCGGLAEHTGVPAWVFRVAFAVTTLLAGLGALAYALLWLVLPLEEHPAPGGRRTSPLGVGGLLGVVAVVLGVLLGLHAAGLPVRLSLWVPLVLAGGGLAVLWRAGDDARAAARRRASQPGDVQALDRAAVPPTAAAPTPSGGPAEPGTVEAGAAEPAWLVGALDAGARLRVLAGVGLLVLGVIGLVLPRIALRDALQSVAATAIALTGMAIIALPWASAWSARRRAERVAAIRAEERAAMAARVHDSVLQTLTLIQRRADDPVEVARLARTEERALRSWLYAPAGPSGSLAAALAEVVAATEADYDTRIELVTVGDVVVDDRVAALVAATREAVRNAAKHAGAPATVYAEVADGAVEVNVRDRGRGFDPSSMGADRHGVRESIVARVQAVGGRAVVRSMPGEGTEVRLELPAQRAGSSDG